MSEHRENRAFRLKMQLAFAVWKRRDLSHAMRLVFTVLLLGHHNVQTGKCNPSYETLASETGMTRHAVIRIVGILEAKGLLAIKVGVGRKNTNSFSFPLLKMVAGEPPIKGKEMVAGEREMVAGQPRNGGREATQNIKEHKEHSEASPLPFESTAPASLKERNGQQGETDEKQEREANLAKLDEAAASLKAMGVKANPKPPPRMNGPTRYKASEADLRLFELQALGVDVDEPTANTPKPKPAPQTLEPALVENQSIFLNATVKVEPPGFPELPDFLRRTPPAPEASRDD